MGFDANVIKHGLKGIDRKIHAAEHSLKSAQWAVDRAEIAVHDQAINLEIAKEVLVKVRANYDALIAQKLFEDEKT